MLQGQERIFAEHLDRLESNDFCDLEKPRKRVYLKEKIESNEQTRKEGGMPDRVESFGEICSNEDRLRVGLVLLNPSEMD